MTLARSGVLDSDLLAQRQFYGSDYTKPLLLVPFIPGLRDIPRVIPVHRLIWRAPRGGAQAETAGQPPAVKEPAS